MAEGTWYAGDIDRVIVTEDQIRAKTEELAKQIAADYADADSLLLVGVLKGALMFMADIARALGRYGPPVEVEFMAVPSLRAGSTSSGVVRILKDLDRDTPAVRVIVVEDTRRLGQTLSWLLKYLASRSAAIHRRGDAAAASRTRAGAPRRRTSASTSRPSSWWVRARLCGALPELTERRVLKPSVTSG
jgi:hypoxanthine phosphoribosyltransferase